MYKQNSARGNALFLILIAVALFAALSYAVTQSGRGSGTINKENLQLGVAQFFSTVASIQSAYNRIRIFNGATLFCPTGDVDGVCQVGAGGTEALCTSGSTCLWAPDGGGVYLPSLPAVLRSPSSERWFFFQDPYVAVMTGVGTAQGEIVIFVDELSKDACEAINTRLGLSLPLAVEPDGFAGGGLTIYPGEPMKCWDAGVSGYQFVYALEER